MRIYQHLKLLLFCVGKGVYTLQYFMIEITIIRRNSPTICKQLSAGWSIRGRQLVLYKIYTYNNVIIIK